MLKGIFWSRIQTLSRCIRLASSEANLFFFVFQKCMCIWDPKGGFQSAPVDTNLNYNHNDRVDIKIWFTGKKLSLLWMLPPPGFYYVKKTREVVFWTFIRRQNHKPLRFFDIIKPRRIEHLYNQESFSLDPYFNQKQEKTCMKNSTWESFQRTN